MSPRARERTPRGHELPSGNTMVVCCKHRNQARQGFCGPCSAQVYCELQDLELKLQTACGFAFDTGRRVAGLEMFIERQLVRR